jgi:hypothetical protein
MREKFWWGKLSASRGTTPSSPTAICKPLVFIVDELRRGLGQLHFFVHLLDLRGLLFQLCRERSDFLLQIVNLTTGFEDSLSNIAFTAS